LAQCGDRAEEFFLPSNYRIYVLQVKVYRQRKFVMEAAPQDAGSDFLNF
jgi:hypothetical protein